MLVHLLYHKNGNHRLVTIIDEVNVKHENYSFPYTFLDTKRSILQ